MPRRAAPIERVKIMGNGARKEVQCCGSIPTEIGKLTTRLVDAMVKATEDLAKGWLQFKIDTTYRTYLLQGRLEPRPHPEPANSGTRLFTCICASPSSHTPAAIGSPTGAGTAKTRRQSLPRMERLCSGKVEHAIPCYAKHSQH